MTDIDNIHTTCSELLEDGTAFLDRLVRFESLPGYEGPCMHWLHEQFEGLADVCEKMVVSEDIVDDPEFSSLLEKRLYADRPNIRIVLKGDGTGKSVMFNAHADIVPATEKQERPFDPTIREGRMYGRGTCDDKGQIAALWIMLKAMKQLGIRPNGDVIIHLVIEEEPGGNGTLALVRHGEMADCCINLEPLSNNVCPSVRGSVWFSGTCYGRAGHSGSAQTTVSALKMAMEAIRIIEEYHDDLLEETIDVDPLFSGKENPMPVNFGELHAGMWPTIVPEKATFSGIFGLLTTPRETVMQEIVERVKTRGPKWLADNFEMSFPYRHDSNLIDPDAPFVKLLLQCYHDMGVDSRLDGATTSTDAWMYTNLLGVPTVATGCGSLSDAHTIEENVPLDDMAALAGVLILFIRQWCGVEEV